MSDATVKVRLQQVQDYQFDVHFSETLPVLRADGAAEPSRGRVR